MDGDASSCHGNQFAFVDSETNELFDCPMNFLDQSNLVHKFMDIAGHSISEQIQYPEHADLFGSGRWTSSWSACQSLGTNSSHYQKNTLMHEGMPMECKPTVCDQVYDLSSAMAMQDPVVEE